MKLTVTGPLVLSLTLAVGVVAARPAAAAQSSTSVSSSDVQRLQDSIYDASRDIGQARTRDAALASQLQAELDDARDDVTYLKVKLRRNEPIPRVEYAEAGWIALFTLMASISLNLGMLNLMPIPVLDGGHIFIMMLEGIARRDFSVRVKEKMLLAGFVVILMLMVTVIYNDLTRISWIERLMPWR